MLTITVLFAAPFTCVNTAAGTPDPPCPSQLVMGMKLPRAACCEQQPKRRGPGCGIVATMPLSEEEFTALVETGCPDCLRTTLAIDALVPQKVPLLGGEPYGAPTWSYKGEDLVRGVYCVACESCKKELYLSATCPRCGAADGVERALTAADSVPLAKACVACGGSLLTATAVVPARVAYDGKRSSKPRAQAAPEEPGFHAIRIECKTCLGVTERLDPCPLCGGLRS